MTKSKQTAEQQMNIIKKLSAMIAILIALMGNSQSQNFTTNLDWKSSYVLMDNSGLFHDKPVIQGDITATFENGLYASIWFSTSPESSWGNDLGDEIDPSFGWSGEIGNGFRIDAALIYFYEPEESFPDIWYPKLVISHEFLGWDVGLKIGVYLPIDGSEGGWLIGPTASKTFEITDKWSIPVCLKLIYDDGGFGNDNGVIPSISTGLNYSINESLGLHLSVAGCTPLGTDDTRKSRVVLSLGTSWDF
jgi:hypothetical protein